MKEWSIVDPQTLSVASFFSYLVEAVIPRPIALVSSMDAEKKVNLSPFSFFNAFSAHPPVLIFSPSKSVRDGSTKHTLDNVLSHPEVVIHIVTYDMVEQTSLSSTAYPKGVNEFIKAGFHVLPSKKVAPPRVKESPIAFECKVMRVISLGEEGGAGNLVLCEVLLMHVHRSVWNENKRIDPSALNAVARLGGNTYAQVKKECLFEVEKPLQNLGIGIDALPKEIKESHVLKGNDLGKLGNTPQLPRKKEVQQWAIAHKEWVKSFASVEKIPPTHTKERQKAREILAQEALKKGNVAKGWFFLLYQKI